MSKNIQNTIRLLMSFICLSLASWGGLFSSVTYASTNDHHLNILVINSYHQEYPWTTSQYEAFKHKFKNNLPEYSINFSTEYLDTKWITPTDIYKKNFISYLNTKYKNHLPDLIYVTDDNALNFIHSNNSILKWDIPIIFSGINNTKITNQHTKHYLSGVFEYKDIHSSIALAKKLNKSSSKIYFLGDGGITDKAIKNIIKKDEYKTKGVELIDLSYSNINTLINKLNVIEDGVVIITTVGRIHNNKNILLDLKTIFKAITNTGKKILVMEDSYLLDGVLGGHVTSGHKQGETAANIASRIIRDHKIKDIEIEQKKSTEFVLSMEDLKRFNIKLHKNILSQATIINKPTPLVERYPELTKILIGFVFVLIIILVGFIYYANRKRKLLIEQYTDSITLLPNRIKLLSDIEQATNPSLMLIDINNFKSINNLYGLNVGDKLLHNFAQNTQLYIDGEHHLYRVNGDKFAIFSSDYNPNKETNNHIKKIIKDIENHTYHIDGIDISLTLTAGISMHEREFLIPRAEQALQLAKENNKDYYIIEKDSDDTDKYRKNMLWAQKVKKALSEDQIVPYFQIIMHNLTGRKNKYEALVRLVDEKGEITSPFFFLDAAKSTRQYSSLTKIMIEKTFTAIKDKNIEASINFTVEDIRDDYTIKFFKEKLNEYQNADKIIVELTESEGIENYTEVAEFISEIKKLGCRVAIDDFGTGYSNFTHLIHLNVDYLKIDGSIIQNIIKDKNAEIVAKTLVEFSKRLNIETIAEFVDSQEILDKVKEIGIDYSQGYFISKPQPMLSN